MELLFWSLAALVVYTYVGYGLIMWLLVKLRRAIKGKPVAPSPIDWPEITLFIAAYNELDYLPAKIEDCLKLDYPREKLRILFVTDGSNDGSYEYLQTRPEVDVLHDPPRNGKIGAMNRGMHFVNSQITIFCDANTALSANSLKAIVRHFENPKVGCVAGEKRILASDAGQHGDGEGAYWKYESALKRFDSELGTVVGAAGELFAIRTTLHQPVERDTLLDDFMISLRVAGAGYKVVYEPEAIAYESPTADLTEELKRKVRICAGGIQSIIRLAYLLNPFKYGFLTFQYVSHRVLRWSLTPIALALLIPVNLVLSITSGGIYILFLLGQVLFYGAATLGYQHYLRRSQNKLFVIPFYFLFMNLSVFMGARRYFKGKQTVQWDKVKRSA